VIVHSLIESRYAERLVTGYWLADSIAIVIITVSTIDQPLTNHPRPHLVHTIECAWAGARAGEPEAERRGRPGGVRCRPPRGRPTSHARAGRDARDWGRWT
jgi:hypothetical protein